MNHCKELKTFLKNRKVQIGVIISLAIIAFLGSTDNNLFVKAGGSSNTKFEENIIDSIIDTSNTITTDTLIKNKPENDEHTVTIESHEIPAGWRKTAKTRERKIDVEKLYDAYFNHPYMAFDYKGVAPMINCLWEFLVNQTKIDPILASSIIANAALEGDFGLKQGTANDKFTSIEDCRIKLSSDVPCGYGIIQWTYPSRRLPLLEFYELAYSSMFKENFSNEDWVKVMMTAECTYLLEEMIARGIITQYENLPITGDERNLIESTTGLLCRTFIGYAGNETQWTQSNGSYYLTTESGSGYLRLKYAYAIYDFYQNK